MKSHRTGWAANWSEQLAGCLLINVWFTASIVWADSVATLPETTAKPSQQSIAQDESPVHFNRDVRPILSNYCFTCHGPDAGQRQAGLRFDIESEAMADLGGYRAFVPGNLQDSEAYLRLVADDPDMRMPPAELGKLPSKKQIATIRRWIEQGAQWQNHWSLAPLTRPAVPEPVNAWQPTGPIDQFVHDRIRESDRKPARDADRRTLIRRLYFDLLGLPPSPEAVDRFCRATEPDAYRRLVDDVLASSHFGERMAVFWLDLVRYADSIGYHSDNPRDVWMYRDYVIQSFNENKPFDQFTIEQLAGDLVDPTTDETLIASGYNRLLQTTQEGGAQPKEYVAKYAADRVRNVSSVWLGATMGCAECHDHKYDPFTTKDFYRLAAFFADIDERAVGRQEHTRFPRPEDEKKLTELDAQIQQLKQKLDKKASSLALQQAQKEWEATAQQRIQQDGQQYEEWNELKAAGILQALAKPSADRSADEAAQIANYFRKQTPRLDSLRKQLDAARSQHKQLVEAQPRTLITVRKEPATVRVLPRGNWLDDSGEVVQPRVPACLPSLSIDERRANRLDLAKWIVSPDNPLTARAMVNRFWKLCFGYGIARTMDDLGAQGQWPTHPRLLDWLAVEFMESGWDMKHVIRLLVMSRSYRQSSHACESLRAADPYNKLFARQSRFRLSAEFIRDNALTVSGLLTRQIGGPSVKPYQPAGYWQHLNFPVRTWKPTPGANLYRRGLYTHWQRTFLHPSLLAFDAPSREECVADRPRSNTPQQALVLLNDPTYVEAARVLAERLIRQTTSSSDADRVQKAYRTILQRAATESEIDLLSNLKQKHFTEFQSDHDAAEQLSQTGSTPGQADLDAAELAAWTNVVRVMLNLHETITRY